MAKITPAYKNSKLASALDSLGSLIIALAVYAMFNDGFVGGLIALVVAFGFKFLASFINARKSQKDAELQTMRNNTPQPAPAQGGFCTKCGTKHAAGQRFCAGCGNAL